MKTPKRPAALLIVAQVICILAMPLTFVIPDLEPGMYSYAVHLRNSFLTTCLIWVEAEAFCVCGRVRKASAFSPKNEKALGRIALALCLAGVLTLLFGNSVVPFLLTDLPAISPIVTWLLMPFALLTLSLMLRTVQLLMRRAMDMQAENDLTV